MEVNMEKLTAVPEKPSVIPEGLEFCCLSVLLGECAGVIYVLGNIVLRAFNWW
jgi:hypothetical protein